MAALLEAMKMRAVILVGAMMVVWAHAASAQPQSYRDCMRFGPGDPPSPSWALLDPTTKATICAQQRAIDKREEKRERDAAEEEVFFSDDGETRRSYE